MKITKYGHSCLLVEENKKAALIDPGNFSEGILPVDTLPHLDYLLITHEHFDHFSLALVKLVVDKYPQIKIITTASVVEQLKDEKIQATTKGDENIQVKQVPHEKMWGVPKMADDIMVIVFGKLAHPGDSHTFSTDAENLALPITGPWGSTTRAVELAIELKPKIIIPIHDFMLKDRFRKLHYDWMADYLSAQGIDFKKIEDGQPIEV